jgi:hypothetical protein
MGLLLMDYSDWGQQLAHRFPARDDADAEAAWVAVKKRLAVGESITGVVVARAPFGAWIDLGVGFPGLLEINGIANLTPEHYRAGDWCLAGSEVTALIGGFRDEGRQIGLWQVRQDQHHNENPPTE